MNRAGERLWNLFWGIMLAIALVVLQPLIAHCASLQEQVLAESGRYLHVREAHNDNRSPEIDGWLRYLGLPLGSPYCAAYVVSMYHQAGYDLPRSGRCSLLWSMVSANELRYQTLSAEEVSMGAPLQVADVIIWRHGSAPGQNWNGHAGLVRLPQPRLFGSREANTQPGPEGDQREGGGVYDRTRSLGFGSSFRVVGFFRVRR